MSGIRSVSENKDEEKFKLLVNINREYFRFKIIAIMNTLEAELTKDNILKSFASYLEIREFISEQMKPEVADMTSMVHIFNAIISEIFEHKRNLNPEVIKNWNIILNKIQNATGKKCGLDILLLELSNYKELPPDQIAEIKFDGDLENIIDALPADMITQHLKILKLSKEIDDFILKIKNEMKVIKFPENWLNDIKLLKNSIDDKNLSHSTNLLEDKQEEYRRIKLSSFIKIFLDKIKNNNPEVLNLPIYIELAKYIIVINKQDYSEAGQLFSKLQNEYVTFAKKQIDANPVKLEYTSFFKTSISSEIDAALFELKKQNEEIAKRFKIRKAKLIEDDSWDSYIKLNGLLTEIKQSIIDAETSLKASLSSSSSSAVPFFSNKRSSSQQHQKEEQNAELAFIPTLNKILPLAFRKVSNISNLTDKQISAVNSLYNIVTIVSEIENDNKIPLKNLLYSYDGLAKYFKEFSQANFSSSVSKQNDHNDIETPEARLITQAVDIINKYPEKYKLERCLGMILSHIFNITPGNIQKGRFYEFEGLKNLQGEKLKIQLLGEQPTIHRKSSSSL